MKQSQVEVAAGDKVRHDAYRWRVRPVRPDTAEYGRSHSNDVNARERNVRIRQSSWPQNGQVLVEHKYRHGTLRLTSFEQLHDGATLLLAVSP